MNPGGLGFSAEERLFEMFGRGAGEELSVINSWLYSCGTGIRDENGKETNSGE